MKIKMEYLLIKPSNDFCPTVVQFKNLLLSNQRINIDDRTVAFSGISLDYTLTDEEVVWKNIKEIVFHFTVSTDAKNVSILEDFDILLHRINAKCGNQFKVNTIWDDVSIHYTNKLYPVIVETENLLRKLIYRFMIKIAGSTWFLNSVPESVREAIRKKAEKNTTDNLPDVDQLSLADFIQLGVFFFEKYTTKPLNQNAIKELRKIVEKKTDTNNNISAFLETYEAKSNWERYFAEKIEVEELYKKWQELYIYRNSVAHTKRMCKGEYEAAESLAKELKSAFEKCIDHIDDVKMTEEEVEAVQEVAKETINKPQMTRMEPWMVKYPGVITGVSELGMAAARVASQVDLDGLSAGLLQLSDRQQMLGTVKVDADSLLIGDKLASSFKMPSEVSELLAKATVPYQHTIDALSIATEPLTTLPSSFGQYAANDAGLIRATDLRGSLERTRLYTEAEKGHVVKEERNPKDETSPNNEP